MESQTETNPFLNRKVIVVGVILLILSSAIGAIIGQMIAPLEDVDEEIQNQQVSISQNSPRGVVIGEPNDTLVLSGTVTAIKGNSLIFKVQAPVGADEALSERTAVVSNSTKITKTVQKDREIAKSESAAFLKAQQDAKTVPQLVLRPDPFTQVSANASEIRIGDIVSVVSTEDVSTKKVFAAKEILFNAPIKTPVAK